MRSNSPDQPYDAPHLEQLPASTGDGSLTESRLLGILSGVMLLGAIFTFLSIAAPHQHPEADPAVAVIGGGMLATALLFGWWRHRATALHVHFACALISVLALALAWSSMVDVAGIQAMFLFLPLVVSASIGGMLWPSLLLVAQSAGYAVVLIISDVPSGLDTESQWLVVTMGLSVGLFYQRRVRATLKAAAELDEQLRQERERQRLRHAERLQLVNDELRATNELKSRFVAMASHELRTPLTSISGFATTMLANWDAISDEDRQHYLGIIEAQSQRLGRLVADLLLVSRIESGRLGKHSRPVTVRPVIERTLAELGTSTVPVHCDPDVRVVTDPDHLQQIVLNLVSNAQVHGAAPITIDVTNEDDAGEPVIVLRVRDSGSGVPAEFVPDLFDRFTRAPLEGGHAPTRGTGLGLSIVDGLATAHGGRAWYEPNLPTGACFCVSLRPVSADADGMSAAERHVVA